MRTLLLVFTVVLLAACESSKTSSRDVDVTTYNAAVRQIGRPPTASRTLADGGLEAIWETEIPGGTRQLVLTFDRGRKLVNSETRTLR